MSGLQPASLVSPLSERAVRLDYAQQLSRVQLATILAEIADGITVLNPAGQLIYGNAAAARLIGYPDGWARQGASLEDIQRRFEVFDESGQPLAAEETPSRRALQGTSSPPRVVRFRVRDTNEEHWLLVTAEPLFDETGALELVVSIFYEITELKRTEFNQRLLAQVSAILSSPLDFETRLSRVAQAVVPNLADWCAIDMLDADGTLRRLTVVHIEPTKVALAHELYRRYPPQPDDPNGLYAILRSGQSRLYPDLSDAALKAMVDDREQLEIARQLQLRSVMIVPLLTNDRPLGAITFVAAESGRRYTSSDLALAEELAHHAALALDNALLYAEAQRLNAELEQRVTARAAQIEAAYARLRDEIAERRQAEEEVKRLNAQLEARVAERTEQLQVVNRELQKEIAERQQAGQTLRSVLRRTRELYHISQTISSVRTPDEILAALLSSSYLTSVSRASIAIFTTPFSEEQPPACEISAAWNKDIDLPNFVGERLTLEELGLLPPYSQDGPIVLENMQTKREFSQNVRRRFQLLKTHSLILFPLIARGAWYGVLSLHFNQRRAIKVDDLRHIRGLVDQAAIVIDSIRLLAAEAQARHEAEEANALKLKFLAMISHELRTPLTSIKGFATTLLADDVHWHPDSQHDFLQTIDEETDKLGDLIEQLLDLSRLEAGTLRIAAKPQTLEHVIATALAQLQTLTVNHQLILDVPRDLPPVYADAERVSQVLTNIVGNAARYSPAQTVITVTAQQVNSMIQIDVTDQGPGIPLSARTRVFDPFEQVERPATTRTGGAGLGLAICKGLVEAHGGRIWVQDRTEPGTTISFTLPIVDEHRT